MRLRNRVTPVEKRMPLAHGARQWIRQIGGQVRERVMDEHALHLRGDGAGLFVDRDDAAGVQRVFIRGRRLRITGVSIIGGVLGQNLVLRILHLKTMRRQLQLSEEDDSLVRPEDVVEEWLIEPDGPQRPGLVAHHELEDLESRPPRRTDAAADDFAEHRRRGARPQLRNGLERAAIFVADRKPVKKVFDGVQAHALEVGGAPRPNSLEILQRRLKGVYCTTIASPLPTRISLMLAGSSKGSSILMPEGLSGDFE